MSDINRNDSDQDQISWGVQLLMLLLKPFALLLDGVESILRKIASFLFVLMCLMSLGSYFTGGIDAIVSLFSRGGPRPEIIDQPDPVTELIKRKEEIINRDQVNEELSSMNGFQLVLEVSQMSASQRPLDQVNKPHQVEVTLDPHALASEKTENTGDTQARLNTLIMSHVRETLHANRSRYEARLDELRDRIKQRAERDIWRHAIDHTPWFVDHYYSDRAEVELTQRRMRQYLFPPEEELNTYYEYVVFEIIHELEALMAELVRESIPGALVKLKSADLHLDQKILARKLRELLPTVDDMVTSMYQKIEERGLNSSPQLISSWERFTLENPKGTIAFQTFLLLSTVALTTSPLVIIGASAMFAVGSGSMIYFASQRSQYRDAIIEQIHRLRGQYESQTDHFIVSLHAGVLDYLEGRETLKSRSARESSSKLFTSRADKEREEQ